MRPKKDVTRLVTEASLVFESLLKRIDQETERKYHEELYEVQYALEVGAAELARLDERLGGSS